MKASTQSNYPGGFFYMQVHNTTKKSLNQEQVILDDRTKRGNKIDWRSRKLKNMELAEMMFELNLKKAIRVEECGARLEFIQKENGQRRLHKAYFCKDKMCPMCSWRRTMKLTYQTKSVVTEFLKEKPKARFLFLTLTLKNVNDGKELDQSLRAMTLGFNRLFKYKAIDKNMLGFMRVTELTVNDKNKSYNQHMHVLMAVSSTYFKGSEYLGVKDWRMYWQKAMKLDYLPQVHISAVRSNTKGDSDTDSAIKETAKYSVKSSDFLKHSHEENLKIVKDLNTGLHRKRMIAYGKMFKEIHERLHLSDAEDGNMIHVKDDEKEENSEQAEIIVANWNFKKQNYYIQK